MSDRLGVDGSPVESHPVKPHPASRTRMISRLIS